MQVKDPTESNLINEYKKYLNFLREGGHPLMPESSIGELMHEGDQARWRAAAMPLPFFPNNEFVQP